MTSKSVALITGCSTGIGFEAALRLARRGTIVFATMRDLTKAGPLQKAVRGLPVYFLALDVDRPASVRKAVAAVRKQAGRIDILINNAGFGAFGAFEDFTDSEILSQYQTNVLGLARVTKEVLPLMRAQKSGRILHIGSLAGKMTFAGIGLYCSSKHAVEALTESLRMEVRPFGIQVAVVEPGSMNTAFKANRRKNQAFLKGKSPYQGSLEKILQFGNNQSARAPGAEKVVDVVEKALNDQMMKIRYPVGKDALLYPVIRWFLPDGLWDLLMRQVAHKFQTAPSLSAPPLPSSAPVALVTGATSGFGLETARLLAREGFQVYATYRDPRKLDALRALIQKEKNIQPLFMDVTRTQTVVQGISRLLKKEKGVDLLVNNAGFVMAGFLEDLSDEELQSQFETNVFGILRVTRAVLPAMRKQRSGKIINVGSISGRVGFPGIGAYAASKFAVRSITEGLRQEVRPFGIEVGEIAPGSFQTKVVSSTRYGEKVKSKSSPYTAFTSQMEELVKKEFAKGGPPERVAALILRAVKNRSIKPVYLAGSDAKTLAFFKWLLPDAWFEALLKLAFPWSRKPF